MPLDFDFLLFFFVPITLLLEPHPAKWWRIITERHLNESTTFYERGQGVMTVGIFRGRGNGLFQFGRDTGYASHTRNKYCSRTSQIGEGEPSRPIFHFWNRPLVTCPAPDVAVAAGFGRWVRVRFHRIYGST